MPHDVKGAVLNVGDKVILEATVVEVMSGEDYCNIAIETVHGRKPDGAKERVSAINAAVLEKQHEPDTVGGALDE